MPGYAAETEPAPAGGHDRPMQGRVALVAGASKGIGAATAEAFADAGAAVVLAARDAAALESVAQKIRARGGRATAIRADVSDADSVRTLVESALDAYGRLDAAFNNATDGPMPAPLAEIDPAEFDRGIATNIRGTFLGMKYQIGAMLPGSEAADREHTLPPGRGDRGGGPGSRYAALLGRDHRPDQGGRPRLRRPGHPGQRRRARPHPHPPPRGRRPGGPAAGRPRLADAEDRKPVRSRPDRNLAVHGFSSYVNGAVIPIDGGWVRRGRLMYRQDSRCPRPPAVPRQIRNQGP